MTMLLSKLIFQLLNKNIKDYSLFHSIISTHGIYDPTSFFFFFFALPARASASSYYLSLCIMHLDLLNHLGSELSELAHIYIYVYTYI